MKKKYILIILVLGVVLTGCGQKAVNKETPADTIQNKTDDSEMLKDKQIEASHQIEKFETICTDWSVYENIELGIRIKHRSSNYSKTCTPEIYEKQIKFILQDKDNMAPIPYSDFTITALENDNSLSGKNYVDYLKEQAAAEGEPWYYSGPGMTEKETKINGYDSYMYDGVFGGDNTYRVYWITYKDKAVSIRFTDSATPNYDCSENLEIFEEMIDSFEFIEENEGIAKNDINLYSINGNHIITSREECENIFGGFRGVGCKTKEDRENIYKQIIKLKNQKLDEDEWEKFNPLSIGGGLRNSDYDRLKNKNGIIYILSGMDGPGGDMPMTGGYYQLISLFFENDNVYAVREWIGDFASDNTVFNSEEHNKIRARAENKENGYNNADDFLSGIKNVVYGQLSKNIKSEYKEGFFTVEEQKKIIKHIESFKNYVEKDAFVSSKE